MPFQPIYNNLEIEADASRDVFRNAHFDVAFEPYDGDVAPDIEVDSDRMFDACVAEHPQTALPREYWSACDKYVAGIRTVTVTFFGDSLTADLKERREGASRLRDALDGGKSIAISVLMGEQKIESKKDPVKYYATIVIQPKLWLAARPVRELAGA